MQCQAILPGSSTAGSPTLNSILASIRFQRPAKKPTFAMHRSNYGKQRRDDRGLQSGTLQTRVDQPGAPSVGVVSGDFCVKFQAREGHSSSISQTHPCVSRARPNAVGARSKRPAMNAHSLTKHRGKRIRPGTEFPGIPGHSPIARNLYLRLVSPCPG